MLIKEIVTEAPVGFFKGIKNAVRSKLPGGQAAQGAAQTGVAANAIFKAVKQWAGGQQLNLDNLTVEDLKQCSVFPSEKEQEILNRAIENAIPGGSTGGKKVVINKKRLEQIIMYFVNEYQKNDPNTVVSEPTTHTVVNTEKGRYTFNPGKGWSFKTPKTTGLGTAIPADDPRVAKLNAAARKQAAEI